MCASELHTHTHTHLVDGLQAVVLPVPGNPAVMPQLLHILQHELYSGRNLSLSNDVLDSGEIVVNTELWVNGRRRK